MKLRQLIQDNRLVKLETSAVLYCSNAISKKEFLTRLEQSYLNEGIGDIGKWIKEKATSALFTILDQIMKQGHKLLSKFQNAVKWLMDKIKSFEKSNPLLFKVIVTLLITMILIAVFTASAHAAATNGQIPADEINMAIAIIEKYGPSVLDDADKFKAASKAITVLMDLRDGKIQTMPQLTNVVKATIDTGLRMAQDMKQSASTEGDFSFIQDLAMRGSKFVSYIHDSYESVSGEADSYKFVIKK